MIGSLALLILAADCAPVIGEARTANLVFWSSSDRAILEAHVRAGERVALRLDRCGELRFVPECVLPGRLDLASGATERTSTTLNKETDLATLIGSDRARRLIAEHGNLTIDIAAAGNYVAADAQPPIGRCRDATHEVSRATIGAFVVRAGNNEITRDGDVARCPGPACEGLVRVVLAPISPAAIALAAQAQEAPPSARDPNAGVCPRGEHVDARSRCVPNVMVPRPPTSPVVRIPAGSFFMGSENGDLAERPMKRRDVAAFELDLVEVPVERYRVCVDAGRCPLPEAGLACNWPDRGDHPVNCLPPPSADAYCAFIGKRLPTEIEWEYAARGSDGRVYPWGEALPEKQLCWKRNRERQGSCPAGAMLEDRSPFGVIDLAGNVSEWTSDKICPFSVPGCGEGRMARGVSWAETSAYFVRSSSRRGHFADQKSPEIGFRCAK